MPATLVLTGGLRLAPDAYVYGGWRVEALGDAHPEDAELLRRLATTMTVDASVPTWAPSPDAWLIDLALARSRTLRERLVRVEVDAPERIPEGLIP